MLGTHTVNYPTRHDIQSRNFSHSRLGEDVGRLQRIQEGLIWHHGTAFLVWGEVEKL